MMSRFVQLPGLLLWGALLGAVPMASMAAPKRVVNFDREVKPVLEKYCWDCHAGDTDKGGVTLDKWANPQERLADIRTWEHVMENVRNHTMPPEKKAQPTQVERDNIMAWIETAVFQCDCDNPDPGRVTIRRLNRTEYNNTIRDLLAINFKPNNDFPADDSGYGFDNIGDVLSVSPVLFEKYIAAARKIMDEAVVTGPLPGVTTKYSGDKLANTISKEKKGGDLVSEGEVKAAFTAARPGEYVLIANVYGGQAGPDVVRMAVRLDGKILAPNVPVPGREENPNTFEYKVQLTPGQHVFSVAFLNDYYSDGKKDRRLPKGDRNMFVNHLSIQEPPGNEWPPLPYAHTKIFTVKPTPGQEDAAARQILTGFTRRAYRRPAKPDEIDALMKLYALGVKQGETFEGAMKLALTGVLVSPHFLFRGEVQADPNNPKKVVDIDEYALASRLSYFIWSSMPDEELFSLAERGMLRKNLEAQIRRMLRDTKAIELVRNFSGQWLQTRNLAILTLDPKTFPMYNDELRDDMEKETELFFRHIMREDHSVLEFIDSDYTFVNERLAKHYGLNLPAVKGEEFQKVSLKGTGRGGLLTQASILTITSNPNRTSPVKRGKWVLENLLGTPPPPPPPDVPVLADDQEHKALTGTLRQRMEQHRVNPVCASCHARMDPIGFGMENFDAIGRFRQSDGGAPIDPSGQLVSGETFKGPGDLRRIIMDKRRDEFIRCLSEKMLTYGLGRGLEYYDKCAVDKVVEGLVKKNYSFSALIVEVATSVPFQKRRGDGDRLGTTSTASAK